MKYLLSLAVFLIAFSVTAQDEETDAAAAAPATPAPPNCDGEKHHQFDFWIGEWVVYSGDQEVGRNTITPMYDGCVLHENWRGQGGTLGQSFNVYDRGLDKWHQTWVDNTGGLLELDGAFVDGNMVIAGIRPRRDGSGDAHHRITYTPNKDGSVRQHWEASRDGENWTTLFDGLYKKEHD